MKCNLRDSTKNGYLYTYDHFVRDGFGQKKIAEIKFSDVILVFYKYLSDSYLAKVYDLLNDETPDSLEEAQEQYEEVMQSDDAKDLSEELKRSLHYTLDPDMTYVSILKDAKNNAFNREKLQAAFNRIQESDELFNELFADVNLYSNRLGTGDQKQSATIAEVIKVLDGADLIHAESDVLGNAYEYLIGQFASETGKKAGEFYTPHGPAQILCRIAMNGQEDKKGLQVYDPCMGSGSLMLSCRNYSNEPDYIKYYGQELMPSTYNLACMNMFLHGVLPENQHLRNGDTLDVDWPTDEETDFNATIKYLAKAGCEIFIILQPAFLRFGGIIMAATKLIAMHQNKGLTQGETFEARCKYVENPDKTEDGKLITAYACKP